MNNMTKANCVNSPVAQTTTRCDFYSLRL